MDVRSILVLTGAGISVAAGYPTYRGEGGLYDDGGVPPLHISQATSSRVQVMWDHLRPLLDTWRQARPTRAHYAISEYAAAHPDVQVTVATQNVDGLHTAASDELLAPDTVLELHGTLSQVGCLNPKCRTRSLLLDASQDEAGVPRCPRCGARCRPAGVLFGEGLDQERLGRAYDASVDADVVIVVGTSLDVSPANTLVNSALQQERPVLWVNPAGPPGWLYQPHVRMFYGGADEALPRALTWIDQVRDRRIAA